MKKIAILILSILFTTFMSKSQCVNCDGSNVINSTNFASALGQGNTSTGLSSFAAGKLNTASGNYSVAIGYGISATTNSAFSAGLYNQVSGNYAMGIGSYLKASQTRSFIIGTGYAYSSPMENNIQNSLMIGFGSTKSTFFVSTASDIDKTGKIGIGDITAPLAKLHIKGDANEDADILLMPNSNKYAVVKFGEVSGSSPNRIVAQPSGDLNFYTASDFVFWNNNVGIGDNNPTERLVVDGNIKISNSESGIILQSHDGQCWKVTVDNTGTLITEAEDCNNPTSIKEPEPELVINIYPNPAKSVVIVEISGEITDPIVQVYSLNGALVLTKKMIRKSTKVNISKLAPGEYIFRLVSNSGVVIKSEKILKY